MMACFVPFLHIYYSHAISDEMFHEPPGKQRKFKRRNDNYPVHQETDGKKEEKKEKGTGSRTWSSEAHEDRSEGEPDLYTYGGREKRATGGHIYANSFKSAEKLAKKWAKCAKCSQI